MKHVWMVKKAVFPPGPHDNPDPFYFTSRKAAREFVRGLDGKKWNVNPSGEGAMIATARQEVYVNVEKVELNKPRSVPPFDNHPYN